MAGCAINTAISSYIAAIVSHRRQLSCTARCFSQRSTVYHWFVHTSHPIFVSLRAHLDYKIGLSPALNRPYSHAPLVIGDEFSFHSIALIKRKISKWNKTATIRATPVDYERNRPFSTDTFCINYFAGQTHVTECKRVNEVNCYPKNGVKRFKRLWTQFHNFINDTAIYLWYWHDELISFQWARCVCLDVHQRVPNCCCWTVKK